MLTPSQLKLYELLKADEQVCDIIETLSFGCKVKLMDRQEIYIITFDEFHYNKKFKLGVRIRDLDYHGEIEEIIGLPLSEHFIRLYCENKDLIYYMQREGIFTIYRNVVDNKTFVIELDNTKDFNSQSEEVYNSICEALINLT